MITLEGDTLVFQFPEVHKHARTEIEFQRTLRIPDDTNEYPLPPGLGRFPIRHTEDFKPKLPKDWLDRGGVILPLHCAEAMWISFRRSRRGESYPCAIKIAAGKINAVSGKRWQPELDASERDYIVVPDQPWLDGYCVAQDQVRQFVAMPMGAGYTAEEQITGKAEHGGLQVIVYPMKAKRYEEILWFRRNRKCEIDVTFGRDMAGSSAAPVAMGLAAGGRMRQQIYADPYGLEAWEGSVSSRCFVTLLDAAQWKEITGGNPRTMPPTAADYTSAGLPWFDYYADAPTLAGAPALSGLKSVAEVAQEKGDDPFSAMIAVKPKEVIQLGPHPGKSSIG
jgi:hypothetical protein